MAEAQEDEPRSRSRRPGLLYAVTLTALLLAAWNGFAVQRGAVGSTALAWARPIGGSVIAVAVSLFASRGAQQFIHFQF